MLPSQTQACLQVALLALRRAQPLAAEWSFVSWSVGFLLEPGASPRVWTVAGFVPPCLDLAALAPASLQLVGPMR